MMWIWTGIPWAWALVFTCVAGGALVLVHLLRPRPRRVKMVTSMFWQEAGNVVHGGRLGGRPSQWLSLLLLFIALLLGALAILAPVWMSSRVQPVVLLIDNGLPFTATESFDQAVQQLAPPDESAVAVIAAAPFPRLLQAPGHTDGRGLRRLAELPSTSVAASGPSLQLADTLSRAMGDADIVVVTCTAERWRDAANALNMPDDIRYVQVGSPRSNTAITGVTWRSDLPLSVQGKLTVRVGAWLQEAGDVQLRLFDTRDGRELAHRTIAQPAGSSRLVQHFDIAALGQALSIVVEGPDDSLAVDDQMQLNLPARRQVIVQPGSEVPEALLVALETAGCVLEEPTSPISPGHVELRLEDDAGTAQAGLIQVVQNDVGGSTDPTLVPVHAVGSLDDINFDGVLLPHTSDDAVATSPDYEPMIIAGDRPVTWLAMNDDVPRIVLDGVWFSSQTSAAASGGFAVMVSRAVTRALHIPPEPATVSAECGPDDLPWLQEQSQANTTAWLAAPGSASVSNLLGATGDDDTRSIAPKGWRVRGRAVLMASTIGLILLSWWLFERGRIA